MSAVRQLSTGEFVKAVLPVDINGNPAAAGAVSAADGSIVAIGATADAAQTDGTQSTTVVGALKGLLLRAATLIARVPVLGQAAKAGSIPVTLASDQGAIAVAQASGTPTTSCPTIASGANATLVAANASRKYLFIRNYTGGTILINPSGTALTGLTPTNANPGIPLDSKESIVFEGSFLPLGAITVWQASGASTNLISVVEG